MEHRQQKAETPEHPRGRRRRRRGQRVHRGANDGRQVRGGGEIHDGREALEPGVEDGVRGGRREGRTVEGAHGKVLGDGAEEPWEVDEDGGIN